MRIKNLANIRDAVASMTWAITPQKLDTIIEVLELRADTITIEEVSERLAVSAPRTQQRAGAVAVIPLAGTLYPKANMFMSASGGVSVDQFVAQVEAAIADPNVSSVVIDVDSPGGAAAGVPEAAARLRALRGKGKPIVAVANTLMASGAYWLASQADSIVASPSADVGSVGVFTVHRDLSKAYEDAGVKHTLIKAGKYKAEGVPFEPLSDEARAALQEKVDDTYAEFLSAVARGRGVSVAVARSDFGQGRVLNAAAAKKAGMVDAIGTLHAVVSDLAAGRTAKYLRASDDTVPLLAEGVSMDGSVVDINAVVGSFTEGLESSVTTARAGAAVVLVPSSDSTPPVAEEPTVENPTNAPTGAAVATPSRSDLLAELAELTGNQAQLFTWIKSGKSVSEIQNEIKAAQNAPKPVSVSVGAQRETQKPWETIGHFASAVAAASMPGAHRSEADPRLFAAASGMNQGVPSQGGFSVPGQFSNELWMGLFEDPTSLVSQCDTYDVDGEFLEMLAIDETTRATGTVYGGVQAYHLNEADQITKSKPKFRKLRLEPQEIGALVFVTEKLLNNSPLALGQYVDRMARGAIAFMANDDIINGDGVGKAKGILKSGCKLTVNKKSSQAADTVLAGNVSDMWSRMPAAVRNRCIWLFNPDIEPQLDEMSTTVKNVAGTENVGGYASPLYNADRQTLKGRPLIANDQCAALGDEGDLILIDPKSYAVGLRRAGVKTAQSMHVRFEYAEMAFRFLFDLDGQSWLNSVITPAKGATKSPIITLQAR